jgi:hypothetical protein
VVDDDAHGRIVARSRCGGRPRQWTDERIEREARELVVDARAFPSLATFKAAG